MHRLPTTNRDDWARIARAGAWFDALPPAFASALMAGARLLACDGGERLFARGDAPDGLYGVLRGTVRVSAVTPGGREALLAMVEAPQWFGEISVFDGAPRTHDAWAEGACELLHVPQAAVLAAVQAHPAGWKELGRLLATKMRATFAAVEEMALLPATPRVAARLSTIAGGYGTLQGQSRRVVGVSQEQLGLMLALSRQTVNQSLRELEDRGAIRRSRGAIEILDADALQRAVTSAA